MEQDTLYQRLGGESGVRQLVTHFYNFMDTLATATTVRAMHNSDLSDSREKLFQYFSGWFGGPALFVERYGHPRLRARHNHLAIDVEQRDAWMQCMQLALAEMSLVPALKEDLLAKIEPMADHMRNVEEQQPLSDC